MIREIIIKRLLINYDTLFVQFKIEKKNNAMPELFNVELKFTIDCSKKWFDRKHKILELNDAVKFEFKQSNPITNEITCCLCDFPLESRAKN